ncbi:unnamed protein product [Echinostoma caproni]|uniref:60S acidic ribosomal protein P1 n=1 Tax=Echinostoma caproni TaxID=27848 RepID=A0A183A0L1_9TREM|nr:unnamed protein product [Echinostoma caproni]
MAADIEIFNLIALTALKLDDQELAEVDCFSCWGSFVAKDGITVKDIIAQSSKFQAAYARLKPLWRRCEISLKSKSGGGGGGVVV